MGTDDWPPSRRLIARLMARPQGFNLFQAISLLERSAPGCVAVGLSHGPGELEAVRLSAFVSLAFQPSDVQSVTERAESGEPFLLSTTVLSLAGATGPLPLPFTELLLERRARKDRATADFLDIFNHRFLSFLYRSKKKHNTALNADAPAQSMLAATLDAVSALGLRAGRQAAERPAVWLRHAGLLGGAPRSMTGLLVLLRDRMNLQVHGSQFVGGWCKLEPDAFTRLVSGRGVGGARLARAAVLGKRVWDQGSGIALVFSELKLHRLLGLLPGGYEHKLACYLIRRYLPLDIDIKMELKLAPTERKPCLLSAANPLHLGWTSWLTSASFRGELPTVQLKLTQVSATPH